MKRVYKCKCHKRHAIHNTAPLGDKKGQGLGTWSCPVTRQKCKVFVEVKNEA